MLAAPSLRASRVRLRALLALTVLWLGLAAALPPLRAADAPPPETVLAAQGQGALPICLAPTASKETRALATELADYLSRMSGATFRVVAAGNAADALAGPRLDFGLLSDFPEQPAIAVQGPGAAEAYRLQSHAGGLRVLGNTPLGLDHAVWDLLHRLGYRHFFPTAIWEIVPRQDRLAIAVDAEEAPDYFVRRIWWGFGDWEENGPDTDTWRRHNRLESTFVLNTGHAFEAIISRNEAAFQAHPEYYGLNDGKRSSTKICVGNPEVVALVVADCDAQLTKNPRLNSVSIDASDGGGWCSCAACEAIGAPSNRMVTLGNAVSDMLELKHPDKYVAFYAYNEHAPPPTIDLKPRIIVNVATAFTKGASPEDLMAGWQARGLQTAGMREYYAVTTWDRDLPASSRGGKLSYLTRSIPEFYGFGARFMSAESSCNFGPNGVGYYLAGRLLWDITEATQVEAIYDDFLAAAFGTAAAPMRRFYDVLCGDAKAPLSRDLIGRFYGDIAEARTLAAADPNREAILARLDALLLYVRYVELYRDYAGAGTGQADEEDQPDPAAEAPPKVKSVQTARQAAFEAMIRHVYRMRRTQLVHSLGLYRDVNARDGGVYIPPEAVFNKPEGQGEPTGADAAIAELEEALLGPPDPSIVGNPWKTSRPWTREELDAMLAAGLAANPTVSFGIPEVDRDLVPAAVILPKDLPRLESSSLGRHQYRSFTWFSEAGQTVELRVSAGTIAEQPSELMATLTLVAGTDPDAEPVATVEVPCDREPHTVTFTATQPGLHTVWMRDRGSISSVDWPPHWPATTELSRDLTITYARRRYLYVYVPTGTKTVGGYHSRGLGRLLDPDGKVVMDFSGSSDFFEVPVKPGHDGRLWQLDESVGRVEFMTIPPYAARHPDELLLPRRIVEAEAARQAEAAK